MGGCSQKAELTAGVIEITCGDSTIQPEGYNTDTFLNNQYSKEDVPSVGDLASSMQEIECTKSELSALHLRLKGTHDDKVLFSVYDTAYRIQSFETESFNVPDDNGKYYICVRVKWIGDSEMGTNPDDYIYTDYYYLLNIKQD